MTENSLSQVRRDKLASLGDRHAAYPNDFVRTMTAGEIESRFAASSREDLQGQAVTAAVAGRVIRLRGPFAVLLDGGHHLQLYLNPKQCPAELAAAFKELDLGDIVGAEGTLFRTGKGELSLRVAGLRMLAKSLRPLPSKHRGLVDAELRYRYRYLDLIANEPSRRVFELRSRIIRCIRDFLDGKGFMEVETPMLQAVPSGAAAKPFVTHHQALGQDMYLRVAPELYLKRLIIGGFDRVYELNRVFRNEGLSARHSPEFTMLEFYAAYADYGYLMDLTEEFLRAIAAEVLGSEQVSYQGATYDFSQPFRRLSLRDAVREYCDAATVDLADEAAVRTLAEQLGMAPDPTWPAGRMLLDIYDRYVEPQLDQPTFVTGYPVEVSPLARRSDGDPAVADRFELIIAGRELANGFSELNDPAQQLRNFEQQAAWAEWGDHEVMAGDADYVRALEHGMPPTAGEGIGIDRLVMLLADVPSIKDVLLFPHQRAKLPPVDSVAENYPGNRQTGTAAVKKWVVKKRVAKKSVAKKSVAKKSVAKKATVKKPSAKKPSAKKRVAKKRVAKKPATKTTRVKAVRPVTESGTGD